MDRVRAPVCVGLDPVIDRLAGSMQLPPDARDHASCARALARFCLGVLEAVAGEVPCVKMQAACFERYRAPGWMALEEILTAARDDHGLEVILDAKRGDIGISAAHYAASAFECDQRGRSLADWITVNAYLGSDGITPFLDVKQHCETARHSGQRPGSPGGGAFALVRTSNAGGDAVQAQKLSDGRTVAESIADLVATIGADYLGSRGYSALGAVVGATKPADAASLRERMPQQLFLIPGYGAQGGSVRDVLPCFDERGSGAIVTASRSVIFAYESAANHRDWQHAVRDAARRMADEVGHAVGMR